MAKSYLISTIVTMSSDLNEPYAHQHRAADILYHYPLYVLSSELGKKQVFHTG